MVVVVVAGLGGGGDAAVKGEVRVLDTAGAPTGLEAAELTKSSARLRASRGAGAGAGGDSYVRVCGAGDTRIGSSLVAAGPVVVGAAALTGTPPVEKSGERTGWAVSVALALGELIGGGARVGFAALPVEAAADAVDGNSLRVAAALYSSRRSCSCWMRCCCAVLLLASDIFLTCVACVCVSAFTVRTLF